MYVFNDGYAKNVYDNRHCSYFDGQISHISLKPGLRYFHS